MSNLGQRYGARGAIGQLGENYFDKALHRAGLTKFRKFRSLSIPDVLGKTRLSGDIDSVLVNGNRVVLIDVKRWAGTLLWSVPGINRPWNGFFPHMMNGKWELSANMSAALDRIRERMPEAEVTAMVVFVPTNSRDIESVPKSVRFLFWPGGIQSFLSGEAFGELYRRLGDEVEDVPESIIHKLTRLQRND